MQQAMCLGQGAHILEELGQRGRRLGNYGDEPNLRPAAVCALSKRKWDQVFMGNKMLLVKGRTWWGGSHKGWRECWGGLR